MRTLVSEVMAAILKLLSASSTNVTGFAVGLAMTLANASSEAPGGIRFRPSGRDRLRGSIAMLTIHMTGNSTVKRIPRQIAWRISCFSRDGLSRPPLMVRDRDRERADAGAVTVVIGSSPPLVGSSWRLRRGGQAS